MKKLLTVVLMLLPIMALAQNRPQDWAQFGRYSEANSALSEKPLAVLYGDSITDSWPKTHPDFFKENNLAGRGISGQTTSQILVRMQQDVVSLAPKYVVILCGINDIAKNTGCAPDLNSMLGSIIMRHLQMLTVRCRQSIPVILYIRMQKDMQLWKASC